jgi:hypothetical protein
MAMRLGRSATAALLATLAGVFLNVAQAQQIHRNGFEGRETFWVKGAADATFHEVTHEITDATARKGEHSEHIQFSAEQGNFIYYYYPTDKAPLIDDLSASVWIKSNRPGIQIMARAVLPKERNPNSLDEPMTFTLRGDLYQTAGRWWRLELRRPKKLAGLQQQRLRAELKRDVDFTDAYIDRIMLNVYAGPGITDVWMDDLEIGPVVANTAAPLPGNRASGPVQLIPPSRPTGTAGPSVLMKNGQLTVNGRRFFMRGIRYTDTPLSVLRSAGFNTVWLDYTTSPAIVEEAINLGFWIVPVLPAGATTGAGAKGSDQLVSNNNLKQEIARFLERDAVLFWDVGGGLLDEQTEQVFQTVRLIHSLDPQRPIGADAWDGLAPYSRGVDLLGAHRWPLLTGLELPQYRLWLRQRRQLARSDTFMWTWIQTHLPDWYTNLVYDRPSSAAFEEPIGPQPEQIRLLTYSALAAGYKGICYWSDRFLADSHQGRDRLVSMALVNQELRMLEPLLMTASNAQEGPEWIDTSNPEVKAAVLRSDSGVLVLPMWLGRGAQFVPGQSAVSTLSFVLPQAPVGTQVWEIMPGTVRTLEQQRVVGGTKVTIKEFGLTTAVVFTADNRPTGLIARLQEQADQLGKEAAIWSHDLAEEEISKVSHINQELEGMGHKLPDGSQLLEAARKRLQSSTSFFDKHYYREANAEAQRALRPLRILMRSQWEQAVGELGYAVASPYALSFYTLPRHWKFMEAVGQGQFGANLLPGGDFEVNPEKGAETWLPQTARLPSDDVEMLARRLDFEPKEGKQCLQLYIKAKNPQRPLETPLERTFLAINSPAVRLEPGTIVRISGWVKLPGAIFGSADGVLFYDDAGGEPLAVRLTEATKWKKFTIFRKVPAKGSIAVTLALTGTGTAYFDDIRIEALTNTTASR